MINKEKLTNYLFLDIETVPQYKNHDTFYRQNPSLEALWYKKVSKTSLEEINKEGLDKVYLTKTSMHSEFSKIVSVGLGYFFKKEGGQLEKRIKMISSNDEVEILNNLKELFLKDSIKTKILFTHNGNSFDLPTLCKRYVYNGYKVPRFIDFTSLKPWEMGDRSFDTIKVLQFGEYNYISFDLLCNVCNVQSPKTDMDGSMVADTYYNVENGLEKIEKYCSNDINSMMDLAVYLSELND